jgi:eukaryotic-like serine/threonine-protein kinase
VDLPQRIEALTMLGQVVLGKYKVSRLLDEGGMSQIYLARQSEPARDIVVKVLKPPLLAQTKTVEHFRREIHITSRFHHANAVACHDSSTKDPRGPLLVLEYLRGIDLNLLLQREGRFSPERAGRLLVQLCDVLQAAHDGGIVHRDIKPGNLMVLYPGTPQETIKLMDFGLAKMTSMLYISPEDLVDFTLPAASGTPEYISPEMVRGTDLDGRGDLYSVGVVLFEMLAGRRPFVHNSIQGLMRAHAEEPPPTFADIGLGDSVPPAIEAVVRSCLGKYPDERPKTAWDLALAYEKALGRRIISARAGNASGVKPNGLSGSGIRPDLPSQSTPLSGQVPRALEHHAISQSVEASMPESMAMVKLKGFIYDLGGEVVESVPGLIKVRLIEKPASEPKTGLFGWMGGGSNGRKTGIIPKLQSTEIELHMERRDPTQSSRITITLVMRPGSGLATTEWRNRCGQISRDLQAYLMGR